jgi:type I restriction enzyme, S subunit
MVIDGWTRMPLGNFVTLQRGHDLPEDRRRPGVVPVLGSFGITGWHDTARARGPGVTVGRSGASFGVVSYSAVEYWPLNTALFVIDFHGNDERFAYYFLSQFDFRRFNSGSAQPSLNRNFVHPVAVEVPPLHEQRAIAQILGTLDDKIELNRQMSATLEEMARALFKSWFVDFDPVRSKAEGRDTGLPVHLAALFPDTLVESELGEIPEGWETAELGSFVSVVKGRSYKSVELAPSDTALVTLKSFARGGGWRADGLKPYTGPYKQEQVLRPGEIVIACTDVTQAAEVIGRAAVVRAHDLYLILVASLDVLIVRPTSPHISSAFLYYLGNTGAFVSHTYAHTTGTTVLHLSKDAVPSFRFTRPPRELREAFDAFAAPTLQRVESLEAESRALAAARDALLPKLISGDLRMPDAETFLERVT